MFDPEVNCLNPAVNKFKGTAEYITERSSNTFADKGDEQEDFSHYYRTWKCTMFKNLEDFGNFRTFGSQRVTVKCSFRERPVNLNTL
ncbi:hypothetical protein XENTR_v10021568 [Xenopus tropicalis]|nr:hypothetical protein XENTR_v10021568 [Xenopus tropicalis]